MSSLKKEAIHGTLWASVELFGQQGIQFFVSIVLARLLEPSEFGLIAMIAIFSSSATVLIEGGFGGALVQRLNVSNTDKSTVFWYNLFVGTIFVMLFWGMASAIADFYHQPRLIIIIRWSIWGSFINCFGIVHRTMLQKALRFREQSVVSVISIILSGFISVLMAFKGYGVWALVAQGLTLSLLQTFGLWIIYPWRPNLAFDVKAFKEMFTYGHNLMFSMIIRIIFENIYQVIIGKRYTATDLGYYYRSKRFTILASQLPTTVTSRVCFPALSKIQKEPPRLVQGYKNFLCVTMLIVVPLLAGIAVTAPNFICVLIGEKWLPSVPYLRLLCLSGVFFPIQVLSCSVLNALGKSRSSLKTEIIKYVMITLSIIGLYRFGIVALLIGEAVAAFLAAGISFYYVSKYLNISVLNPVKWLGPVFFCSALMVIGVASIRPDDMSLGALGLKTGIGVLIYLGVLILLRYQMVVAGINAVRIEIVKFGFTKKG